MINAVIAKFRAMLETFKLLSTPGMAKRFEEAKKTPMSACEEFEW